MLSDHASVCHAHAETSQSLLSEFTYPPPLHLPFKKDGSSKICWKSHFSKSIFLLILRVVWAVNGARIVFKISSIFLLHGLACFLDFLSIGFVVEHCEFKKKDGSSKICWKSHFSTSIFLLILKVIWAVNGAKIEFKTYSIFWLHGLACFRFSLDRFCCWTLCV